jgi:hypothetical protein
MTRANHCRQGEIVKRILLAMALMASVSAFAQNTPPSEASVRELLEVTNAKSVLDGAWGQLDGLMEKAMKDAIGDKPVTEKQEKIMAAMRAETVELIRSDLSWDKMEPMYIREYSQAFSQAEIDGMLVFYKSDAGKAVTAKMPQLLQIVMQDVMTLLQGTLPKMRAISETYIRQLKDAD